MYPQAIISSQSIWRHVIFEMLTCLFSFSWNLSHISWIENTVSLKMYAFREENDKKTKWISISSDIMDGPQTSLLPSGWFSPPSAWLLMSPVFEWKAWVYLCIKHSWVLTMSLLVTLAVLKPCIGNNWWYNSLRSHGLESQKLAQEWTLSLLLAETRY